MRGMVLSMPALPVSFPLNGYRKVRLLRRPAIGVMVVGLLGACAAPPKIMSGPSPSDPAVRVPALAYQPITGGVKSFRPVEPKGWEELNRNVGPKGN